MSDPPAPRWSEARIAAAEKYLDRILAKLESAKADVEKNWIGQIASIAISLALVAGLGSAFAHKYLDDPQRYSLLYVVFPVVNTYFFVRFGLIGGVFSKARFNAERLTRSLAPHQELPDDFDVTQVYRTNSYFEWAHYDFSPNTVVFLFTIPLVFAANHALTVYLVYKILGASPWFCLFLLAYLAIMGTCYVSYYYSNKDNTVVFKGKGHKSFIVVVIATAAVATAAMLSALARFDPNPELIEFKIAEQTASNASVP